MRAISKADKEAALAQVIAMKAVEANEWGPWEAGQTVGITGERGSFTIKGFRLDDNGGCKWVTLIGGSGGTKQFRSVLPTRLKRGKR